MLLGEGHGGGYCRLRDVYAVYARNDTPKRVPRGFLALTEYQRIRNMNRGSKDLLTNVSVDGVIHSASLCLWSQSLISIGLPFYAGEIIPIEQVAPHRQDHERVSALASSKSNQKETVTSSTYRADMNERKALAQYARSN